MLINFALEAVGTKVSSSKISTDGCECCNLISSDFRYRNKGFVAEHFIKPPVDVTLAFSCHVNLFCVTLNPFVGQQQSSQIEVFCASRPVPKTKHGQRLVVEENKQLSSFKEEPMPMFYPVSKIIPPNCTRICFHSRRFPAHVSSRYKSLISPFESSALAEMRHSKPELLTAVSHLMIRISRTQNGSTPALSNIEVWGSISSQVSAALQKIICDKYQAFSQHQAVTSALDHAHVSSSSSTENKADQKKTVLEGVPIPEEFLDPLTCEIMSIPMLLPCGKNVDKASLDRYFDSEASHGRQPRDPFTGVEFHGEVKPIPNGSLKARIDHFLSENSHDPSISSLPRTVISGKQGSSIQKRKLDTSLHVSSIVKKGKYLTQTLGESFESFASTSAMLPLTSSVSYQSSSASPSVDNNHPYLKKICQEKLLLQNETESLQSDTKHNSHSHESSLKDSLDYALSTLLGSSPGHSNYVQKSSTHQTSPSLCSKCEKELSEKVVTYVFPCSHFLCRLCLLSCGVSESRIKCFKCGKTFLRSDVVRTHSTSSS